MKKYITAAVAVIILVLLFVFKPSQEDGTITIGFFAPLSGPVADVGEIVLNGWKLGMKEFPEINGKKVKLVVEDDGCDPKKAVTAENKLIDIDHAKILVSGVCSGSTVSAAPIAEAKKVILFTPVSTSPKLTDAGDYVFRTSGVARQTAQAAVLGIQKMRFAKVAVLFENAEYAIGWKDSFVSGFAAIPNAKILGAEGVGSKDTDFKTQIIKLAALKPEVFVVSMNSGITANNAVKQIRELGIKVPIVGAEYLAHQLVLENPVAEGVYATMYDYEQSVPSYIDFMKKYEAEYGKKPLLGFETYPMLAYDGAKVLMGAVTACGNDNPECIKEKLYAVKDYQGVSGVITIDKNGDTNRQYRLFQIQSGNLVPVK